jgi:glycosyltransferase involved in cell wall biosynthesis
VGPTPILLMVRRLNYGGCERDLAKVALGLDPSEFKVYVGCFRLDGLRVEELRQAGIPLIEFPVRSFRSFGAMRAAIDMRRCIRDYGIQLVHCFDVPTSMWGAPVARLWNVPVICSQLSYRTLCSSLERRVLRFSDRVSAKIVVNCVAMQRHVTGDEGVPVEKTYLCYNGVDTSIFHPGTVSRPPELSTAAVVIGTVANLRQEKGIDLLLKSFSLLRQAAVEAKLLIVGDGPEMEPLRAMARQLGIANDTLFLIGKPDISEEMRGIDIFVLPSYSEAFSNALLEAMASGCAVIGSNVGGTPELIEDGENGFLFQSGSVEDLAAKLRIMVENAKLRLRFQRNSAARARNEFSLGRNLACFRQLYRSLTGSGSGA